MIVREAWGRGGYARTTEIRRSGVPVWARGRRAATRRATRLRQGYASRRPRLETLRPTGRHRSCGRGRLWNARARRPARPTGNSAAAVLRATRGKTDATRTGFAGLERGCVVYDVKTAVVVVWRADAHNFSLRSHTSLRISLSVSRGRAANVSAPVCPVVPVALAAPSPLSLSRVRGVGRAARRSSHRASLRSLPVGLPATCLPRARCVCSTGAQHLPDPRALTGISPGSP